MTWAIFNNLDTFDSWHEEIKIKLGYPLVGYNAKTGEEDLENLTTNYTQPMVIADDERVIAWVGENNENLSLIDRDDAIYQKWFDSLIIPIETQA